jgi:DNA polymerase III alpha subunit
MAWSLCVHLAEEDCLRLIPEHYGDSIDLAQLPEDTEVYRTLQRADTVGMFQVESRAQMASLPRNNPEKFYDVVVQVAIIRPGPIVGKKMHPYMSSSEMRLGRAGPGRAAGQIDFSIRGRF